MPYPSPEPNVTHAASQQYHARMQRVLDHIDAHLDDDLSLAALSAVAAFSPHHFHRQFAVLFGITARRYVQLLRMKRASFKLAFRDDRSITDIALDSGYESPEAFARAFRQHTGQPPGEFRNEPDWAAWQAACGPSNDIRSVLMTSSLNIDQVRIVDVPAVPVAVLEHRGDPRLIGDTIRRFIAWRRQVGLPPRISRTFNLLHADPDSTPPEDYRLDLCAATADAIAPNEYGVVAGTIPGGRCAVFRQIGASDDLRRSVHFLYAEWLPQSGEDLRDFPVFVERISFFPDVPEHEAITDVFLPLR